MADWQRRAAEGGTKAVEAQHAALASRTFAAAARKAVEAHEAALPW